MQTFFAANLRVLLHAKGMTMAQLAENLGIKPQSVSKWATGENVPDVYNLIRVSDIFGVSIDNLIRSEIKPQTADDKVDEIRQELDEIKEILRKMQAT